MLYPRCEMDSLDEREREGITIDVCQKCRGVWLDRGELEKLISREAAAWESHGRAAPAPERGTRDERPYPDERRPPRRDHDDDDDYRSRHYPKRGFLGTLGELFD